MRLDGLFRRLARPPVAVIFQLPLVAAHDTGAQVAGHFDHDSRRRAPQFVNHAVEHETHLPQGAINHAVAGGLRGGQALQARVWRGARSGIAHTDGILLVGV